MAAPAAAARLEPPAAAFRPDGGARRRCCSRCRATVVPAMPGRPRSDQGLTWWCRACFTTHRTLRGWSLEQAVRWAIAERVCLDGVLAHDDPPDPDRLPDPDGDPPALADCLRRPATGDPRWGRRAACLGFDPAVWFPPKGGTPVSRVARTVCGGCPVLGDCREHHRRLADAGVRGQAGVEGVWFGTTSAMRRRARRPPPAPASGGPQADVDALLVGLLGRLDPAATLSPAEAARRLGVSTMWTQKRLAALADAGRVRRAARGRYALPAPDEAPPDPRAAAALVYRSHAAHAAEGEAGRARRRETGGRAVSEDRGVQ